MEREKTEYKDLVRKLNTWKYDEKIHREYYFMEKLRRILQNSRNVIPVIANLKRCGMGSPSGKDK